MNFQYDVIIVGGGPIGSTLAYALACDNLNVCIIEKKKKVGFPLQCAGIVSKSINDNNEIPKNLILNKVKGAYLHSKNNILKVEKKDYEAFIIDRIAYDKFLLERALNIGVKFKNKKVISHDFQNGKISCDDGELLTAKIIVGADGPKSFLSESIGNNLESFNGSQFLVRIRSNEINKFRESNDLNLEEYVDTFVKEDLLFGFLWIIPLNNDLYRIGLFSKDPFKKQTVILNDFLGENFLNYDILEKYNGLIPIFNENNILVKKRALLIGDAAGQVKPTTGGGLIIGFNSCKIASKYIVNSIREDNLDILNEYSNEFKNLYFKELNYQFKVQKIINNLSDNDLDYLFTKLKKHDCENLISKYGDMDKQSVLVKEFIKRGLIFKIVPNFFIKKVSRILDL